MTFNRYRESQHWLIAAQINTHNLDAHSIVTNTPDEFNTLLDLFFDDLSALLEEKINARLLHLRTSNGPPPSPPQGEVPVPSRPQLPNHRNTARRNRTNKRNDH